MNRRRFLMTAPAFLAAPALVRATSIMPVRAVPDCDVVKIIQQLQSYRHDALGNEVLFSLKTYGLRNGKPFIHLWRDGDRPPEWMPRHATA